jgi:hypothetical protein
MEFRVTWEIDVDGKDPVAAAIQTLATQQSTESIATFFEVRMLTPCPSCHCLEIHKENCRLRKRFAKYSSQPDSLRIDQVYGINTADFIRQALKRGHSAMKRTANAL